MASNVIDAKRRFPKPSPPPTEAAVQLLRADRVRRQQEEAAEIRAKLAATPRLSIDDRKAVARNLGRAIERMQWGNLKPKQICTQLFHAVGNKETALSMDKKRKRYIRFDGEPLNEYGPDEKYAADGKTFLRLIDGLATLGPNATNDATKDNMLLHICDGTSFSGPTRTRVYEGQDPAQQFKNVFSKLIDHIVRSTDIIKYFDKIQHYTVKIYPDSKGDILPENRADLHKTISPVYRFEHQMEKDIFYEDEDSRLRLNGFDIRWVMPRLYPGIRLARIYWPRHVLCLPASVPTKVLDEIRTRPLSAEELAGVRASLGDCEPIVEDDGSVYDPLRDAISSWREEREYELWLETLREADIDPEYIDWTSFEDDTDRSAICGAEWRVFWQTINVNLHLIADGHPEALRFGLSFAAFPSGWWTDAFRDLRRPYDDDVLGADIPNCTFIDEEMRHVAWMPDGDRSYICRGFKRTYIDGWSEKTGDATTSTEEFEDEFAPYMRELTSKILWPMQAKAAWSFLNLRMEDWRSPSYGHASTRRNESILPCLRTMFDSPPGWTSAPDGSLASAMLSSLARGEGEERLDNKIIASINSRVRCLTEMKERLSRQFDAELAKRGYAE